MKPQLKFSLFVLFVFVCVFMIWFFAINKALLIATNEHNASEYNETNLTLQKPLLQTQRCIKGLFVDYCTDSVKELNLSEMDINFIANSNTFDENNSNLFFDATKVGLLAKRHYRDIFNPIQSDYFNFFYPENFDTNSSALSVQSQKPKLCIIIDDMASREQVIELKAIGLKLTPSFFPVDRNHPKTHILAREFDFFMVHLPLAAVHYSYEERQTLKPDDSQELINAKIAQITRDFRGVKFINNHTGSLFTSDVRAMRKLFRALKQHHLIFVDSITIGSSKGSLVSKEFGQVPIKRDIFLDNESDLDSIKAQIQEAVHIAHKKGFAIAIGHPKKNTFEALKQSKALLESVELVYLSEVYENP